MRDYSELAEIYFFLLRFFPADNNKYRNGNVLAGTVVDQGINHPTEVSEAGLGSTFLFTLCRETSTS